MTTISTVRLVLVMVVLAIATSCASLAGKPQIGDISFRLTWTGEADLDLYVESPLGERVDFTIRSVASGGMLDVDCNVRHNMCPVPMENIFWPRGTAPFGTYRYTVNDATAEGTQPEGGTYTLEVRIGNKIVKRHTGTTNSLVGSMFRSTISFDRRR
jgi:hypothetical protein